MARAVVPRIVVATLFAVLTSAALAPIAADATRSAVTGGVQTYVVAADETWRSIASRMGVDVTTLASENGRLPDVALEAGDELTAAERGRIEGTIDRLREMRIAA